MSILYNNPLALSAAICVMSAASFTAAAQQNDWDGVYVGGLIGYGSGDVSGVGQIVGVDETDELRGVSYGIAGGYGFRNRSWVYGLEADISGTNINGDLTVLEVEVNEEINWAGNVRARVGYLVQPNLLVYGAVGASFADYDINTGSTIAGNDNASFTGWTVGGGVERILSNSITGRLEYLYSDFGSENMFNSVSGVDIEADAHTVRVGLFYNF